jgi:voltage-gated potassium channel
MTRPEKPWLQGVLRSARASRLPLIAAIGILSLLAAGFGFYVIDPEVRTIEDGIWLAFTSGATVGYGDIVPSTRASRLFAAVMVLCGICILSVGTASIAALFVSRDERSAERAIRHEIRALHAEIAALRRELEKFAK